MRKLIWPAAGAVALLLAFLAFRAWNTGRQESAAVDAIVARARDFAADPERLSQARVELDVALKRDPNHIEALVLRGEVLLRLALLDEAEADLARALKSTTGERHAQAQLFLGRVHASRYRGSQSDDDFRGARNAFLAAQQSAATKPAAMEGFALLFLEKGRNRDVDKALDLLRQLVAQHADSEEAGYAKELLEQMGRSSSGD